MLIPIEQILNLDRTRFIFKRIDINYPNDIKELYYNSKTYEYMLTLNNDSVYKIFCHTLLEYKWDTDIDIEEEYFKPYLNNLVRQLESVEV